MIEELPINPVQEEGVEEDDLPCLEGFFVSEEYREFEYYFGDPGLDVDVRDELMTEKLLCSNMSCTDFDLTGQIIWPAAMQLSHFIHNPKYTSIFKDKYVVELGSGAGLSGFVAAKYASKVLLTDGNEVVMRLLDLNCDHIVTASPSSCPVRASYLNWGEKDAVAELIREHGVPEVLCGADIIMWPNYVLPLLETIHHFLIADPSGNMACYVSYVVRAHSTTRLVEKHASELGLRLETIKPEDFLPPLEWQNKGLILIEQKYMFKISLLSTSL